MQIAKSLVSWPVIGGDNSATQIQNHQNDSEGLHNQVLSAVCCIVSHSVYHYCIVYFGGAFDSGGSGDSSWETNLCESQQRGERTAH